MSKTRLGQWKKIAQVGRFDNTAVSLPAEDMQIIINELEAQDKRIEELKAALHTYGRHHRTCSKWDELDIGTSFIRTNWPCDCGLRKALGEGE